jgi:hypothetical protein
MADPKPERIVQELIRRLELVYPRMPIERGFFAEEVTLYPSIYIFEDVDKSTLHPTKRRGRYERIMLVHMSYFLKGPTNRKETYAEANRKREELYHAIELDEYFIPEGDPKPLCTQYGVTESVKVFYKSNAIQLAITYAFAYVEDAPWA